MFKREHYNSAIIAKQGSGKTTQYIIPEVRKVINKGESFLVADPKLKIINYVGNELEDNGYKIFIFNFRDFKSSSTWNPLEEPYSFYCKGKKDVCMSMLFDLADEIFEVTEGKDDFWVSSAKDFFVGLSLILFEDAHNIQEINFKSLYYFAIKGEEKLGTNTFLKEYIKIRKPDIFDVTSSCVNVTLNSPSDTRGGIISTYLQSLRVFDKYSILSKGFGQSDFSVSDISRKKVAIFIQYADEKDSSSKVVSMLIRQIFKELIRIRTLNPNKYNNFSFFFDDFLSLNKIKKIENFYTTNGERKIKMFFAINDISLLKKIYGTDITESFLKNCDNIFCLNESDINYIQMINRESTQTWLYNETREKPHNSQYLTYNTIGSHKNVDIPYFRFDEIVLNAKRDQMYHSIHNKTNSKEKAIQEIDSLIQKIEVDNHTINGVSNSNENKKRFPFSNKENT